MAQNAQAQYTSLVLARLEDVCMGKHGFAIDNRHCAKSVKASWGLGRGVSAQFETTGPSVSATLVFLLFDAQQVYSRPTAS